MTKGSTGTKYRLVFSKDTSAAQAHLSPSQGFPFALILPFSWCHDWDHAPVNLRQQLRCGRGSLGFPEVFHGAAMLERLCVSRVTGDIDSIVFFNPQDGTAE
ncbi:hypothetical protein N9059_00220 [bacterium]|nr:hypothetical protein [bacterium]